MINWLKNIFSPKKEKSTGNGSKIYTKETVSELLDNPVYQKLISKPKKNDEFVERKVNSPKPEPPKNSEVKKNIKDHAEQSQHTVPPKEKSLNGIIAEMLQSYLPLEKFPILKDAKLTIEENALLISPHNIRITCFVIDQREEGDLLVSTFAFVTQVNEGKKMIEEVPGYAKIHFEMYMRGLDNFSSGFLNTFFASYFGIHEPKYSLRNKLGIEWHTTIGDLQVQGAFNEIELEQNHFAEILHPKFKEFQENLEDEYYAVKSYLSRNNGSDFNGEVRIDNEKWDIGLSELLFKDYDYWIQNDEFLAKKQWIILKKCRKENG